MCIHGKNRQLRLACRAHMLGGVCGGGSVNQAYSRLSTTDGHIPTASWIRGVCRSMRVS